MLVPCTMPLRAAGMDSSSTVAQEAEQYTAPGGKAFMALPQHLVRQVILTCPSTGVPRWAASPSSATRPFTWIRQWQISSFMTNVYRARCKTAPQQMKLHLSVASRTPQLVSTTHPCPAVCGLPEEHAVLTHQLWRGGLDLAGANGNTQSDYTYLQKQQTDSSVSKFTALWPACRVQRRWMIDEKGQPTASIQKDG
jgi:hypothetical protein